MSAFPYEDEKKSCVRLRAEFTPEMQNSAAKAAAARAITTATVRSVGQDEEGTVFALADTSLTDGTYQARVNYKQTQIIKLLFN